MARSAFYEESAISTNERKERRAYQVFHIASIVMLVIAALLILFSLTSVPSILSDEKLTGTQKAVSIVVWFLPILSLVGFFFLFRFIKRRKNLSFDYTFVEDELRVTVIATGFDEKEEAAAPAGGNKPFTSAGAKVEEQRSGAVVQPAAQNVGTVEEKPAVSDDDWDILERIFNRKR